MPLLRPSSVLNAISGQIVDSATKVHSALGPGLLESPYEACLSHELRSRGLSVQAQVEVPLVYAGIQLAVADRLDLLVENAVVVDIKSVHLRDGIKRMVNNL